MKGYVWLTVCTAAVMMLLPLPSYGLLAAKEETPPPPVVSPPPVTEDNATAEEEHFRVLDAASGNIIEMSERDFLIGTLAAEMYPSYHLEALKAQAVAAYTYYCYEREGARPWTGYAALQCV